MASAQLAQAGKGASELGRAVEALTQLARILERANPELGLSHYRVLSLVAAGDARASRLARRLALGKPAISAAVESLVGRGLLTRSAGEEDRRAIRLEITGPGRRALARARAAMSAELAEVVGHCPDPAGAVAAFENLALGLELRQAARATPTS
ncbi:MAG TPA: MarR family winged helix-turn-helix transcriptional regulator [Candidatus Dormibacteraeota bacterium]